jgi:hypothetical protein
VITLTTNGDIVRTTSHTSFSPAWEVILSAAAFTGNVRRLILDPWNPAYRAYVASISGPTSYLYEVTNIMGTPTATLLYSYSGYGVTDVAIHASINVQGELAFLIRAFADAFCLPRQLYRHLD